MSNIHTYAGYETALDEYEGGWYYTLNGKAHGPYATEFDCFRAWRRAISILRRHPK